jgi:hypothetical protein
VATVNIEIQKALLRHQVDLLRLEAGTRTRAINAINQMTNELYGMLTDKDITKFSKSRITAMLSQTEDTINRYYGRIQDFSDRTLEGAAQVSAKYAGKTLDATFIGIDMEASLPSVTVLEKIAFGDALIMGATTDEWWERQARDVAFRFSTQCARVWLRTATPLSRSPRASPAAADTRESWTRLARMRARSCTRRSWRWRTSRAWRRSRRTTT